MLKKSIVVMFCAVLLACGNKGADKMVGVWVKESGGESIFGKSSVVGLLKIDAPVDGKYLATFGSRSNGKERFSDQLLLSPNGDKTLCSQNQACFELQEGKIFVSSPLMGSRVYAKEINP